MMYDEKIQLLVFSVWREKHELQVEDAREEDGDEVLVVCVCV